jgi:hypothetical protein
MEITKEYFTEKVGRAPEQDDLERCNCKDAGKVCHSQCGWNYERDLPVFMVGRTMDLKWRGVINEDDE